jgi:methyl-accepting chemotaxis protein
LKSIGKKAVLANLLIFITGYLILGIVILSISYTYVSKEAFSRINESAEKEVREIEGWLQTQESIMKAIANDASLREPGSRILLDALKANAATFNEYSLFYIGYTDGSYLASNEFVMDASWDPRTRPWFLDAVSKDGEVSFSEPYIDSQSGVLCITISKMLPDKSVLAGDIPIDWLSNLVDHISYSESGYGFLLSSEGNILAHAYNEYKPKGEVYVNLASVDNGRFANWKTEVLGHENGSRYKDYDGIMKHFIIHPISYTNWQLGSAIPDSILKASSNTLIAVSLLISLVIWSFVAIFLNQFVKNLISQPISEVEAAADELARGGVSIKFDRIENDEIGKLKNAFLRAAKSIDTQSDAIYRLSRNDYSVSVEERSDKDIMAQSINHMAKAQRNYIHNISEVMGSVSKGDLDVEIDMAYEGDLFPIKESINHTISSIKSIIAEVSDVLSDLPRGKLSRKIEGDFPGVFSAIKDSINYMAQSQKNIVSDISQAMGKLREGSLDGVLHMEYSGDYEPIRSSITDTLKMLRSCISEIKRVLTAISCNDLTKSIQIGFRGEFIEVEESISLITASLSKVLKSISVSADQVAGGASHVSSGSSMLAQGANSQKEAVQSLAEASSLIAEKAEITAKKATDAISLSEESIDGVEKGAEQMSSLVRAISEISEASRQIKIIVRTISDIAFQTNLLALNAAVEAARSGSAGKGFSVVAEEVRGLANKTSDATKNISALIENSTQAVEKGSKIANNTADAFGSIVASTKKTSSLIEELAQNMAEQSSETLKINSNLDNILEVVLNISSTSEQSAAASQELSAQACFLNELANQFELKETTMGEIAV